MADESTGYKHDASDRKLDKAADATKEADQATDAKHTSGPGHDPAEIRKHDDKGKDRLFEGREQHDDADLQSEKNRRARDEARHHHAADDDATDAGSGGTPDQKN